MTAAWKLERWLERVEAHIGPRRAAEGRALMAIIWSDGEPIVCKCGELATYVNADGEAACRKHYDPKQ